MEEQKKEVSAYEKLGLQTSIDPSTIAVIHNSVAKGTTLSELAFFLNVAKGVGLNPFNKEIWCYKDYRGNLIVLTGRDGFLTIGQRHPRYNGLRSGVVCKNDTFKNTQGSGKPVIEHSVNAGDRGEILGAWAIAFLKDGEEFFEWVDFKDYNKGKNTWETNPKAMIVKVAEGHALKKAFGVTGLHSQEDFEVVEGIAVPVRNDKVQTIN